MIAIAAACENGGIGREGALLFHIREDLRRFRQLTLGKTVVMGRRTLESLPGGRGLPDRRNLVLTRDTDFTAPGAEVIHDLTEVPEDAVVIGGESVGKGVDRQLLPRVVTVYLTRIFAAPQADAFFPDLSRDSAWTEAEQSETFTSGGVSFQYVTYRRK